MPEKITAIRCEGPCGKVKPFSEYLEHRPGEFRKVCKACFNARRAGRTHGGLTPGKPYVRQEKLEAVAEHRLKVENRDLREKTKELARQLSEGGEYNEVVRAALATQRQPPSIKPRERKSGLREGTPLILASDWHIEQEVKPEAVAGRNRYNLSISKQRMQNFFEAIAWACRQQGDTFKIRDIMLWLGGDFIQNFLHEDDVENNLLAPLAALQYWETEVIAGFDFLLKELDFEQAIIPCNDGNHGRTTKKMRSSTRQRHSLETFAYAQLALHYRNEKRLKFILPTSQFTFVDDVYGRTIRFLHGDVFKYAGGVGGITVPLFRAMARWEKTKHADLTCLGHYHQRYCLPDCMVNGSMIGYDSYAMGGGFPFEMPVQSLRMLDSKRWTGADIPLYVAERSDDIQARNK